ncbi:universal stress protein [Hymenobacter sp. DG01]|uniref:universal stress protein n=1 Tax=Hymenobacter sp. DG01 TaxID=2584940 RepID=UPI00112329DB|nr:universal stress protein [Hymenobacter sp. DG01]
MATSLLLLTDFFQAAGRALAYATNLAEPLQARLVLLHVRRDSVLDPEMFSGQLSNLSREAITLALQSVTRQLRVPVVAEVGHGRVAFAVADAVSRHQPALVVLGRPDYSATPDELVQTTSLDILRAAPYPMLVVPHSVESSGPPRRLLLALDGEAFDLGQHAGPVRELLSALQAQITVVHIRRPEAATDEPSLEAALPASLGLDWPVTDTRVVSGTDPAEGILQAARPTDYDAVMLIARRRSFLGNLFHRSVTARVLLHSELPVLVLPAQ